MQDRTRPPAAAAAAAVVVRLVTVGVVIVVAVVVPSMAVVPVLWSQGGLLLLGFSLVSVVLSPSTSAVFKSMRGYSKVWVLRRTHVQRGPGLQFPSQCLPLLRRRSRVQGH